MMDTNKDLVEMTLEMFTSNDAFVDNPNRTVAQTLRRIADNIEYGGPELEEYIYDLNGNRIGNFCLEINEDFDE